MHTRYIIVCLGILIIAQLVFFTYNESQTIKSLKIKSRQFDAHISRLEKQKQTGQKNLDDLVQIFNTVRPWLNTGHEDPEHGLMTFLDFLEPGLLDKVGAKVSLSEPPSIETHPILLQRTNYQVTFDFNQPEKVESFLSALLLQHEYPLKVNSLDVNRDAQQQETEENQVIGTLNMDLLLPANLMNLNLEELKTMGVL